MYDVECVLCVIYILYWHRWKQGQYCTYEGKTPFGGSRRPARLAPASLDHAWTDRGPSIQLGHTACCTFHVSETRMNFLVLFCIKSPSNKSRLEDSRGPGSSAHYSLRAQRGLRAEEQNLFPVEGHVNGGYYKGTPNHLPFHLNACSTSSSVVRREPLQHDTVKVHFRYRTNRTNLPESVPPISFRGITFTYLHLP